MSVLPTLVCLINPCITAFHQIHLTLREHDKDIFLSEASWFCTSFSLNPSQSVPTLPVPPPHGPPTTQWLWQHHSHLLFPLLGLSGNTYSNTNTAATILSPVPDYMWNELVTQCLNKTMKGGFRWQSGPRRRHGNRKQTKPRENGELNGKSCTESSPCHSEVTVLSLQNTCTFPVTPPPCSLSPVPASAPLALPPQSFVAPFSSWAPDHTPAPGSWHVLDPCDRIFIQIAFLFTSFMSALKCHLYQDTFLTTL